MNTRDVRVPDGWAPPDAPPGWAVLRRTLDGAQYGRVLIAQTVIISANHEEDGRDWVHFSMSGVHRVPRWDEFVEAKEAFLGKDSKAIQVIPPRDEYVNINPHVLHLFVCLTEDVLPDFTQGSGSL